MSSNKLLKAARVITPPAKTAKDQIQHTSNPISKEKYKYEKESVLSQKARLIALRRASEFTLCMFPFLLACNRSVKKGIHANMVLSNIFNKALTGSFLGMHFEFKELLVTNGNLPLCIRPIIKKDDQTLQFYWSAIDTAGKARGNDKVILVAYCEALNKCIFTIGKAKRNDEEASLDITPFEGQEVHSWMGFMSDNGKLLSPSIYTGAYNMADKDAYKFRTFRY